MTDDAALTGARRRLLGVRVSVWCSTPTVPWSATDDELRERIGTLRGVDAAGWDFLASTDQLATLHDDIGRIRSCPLLPPDLLVAGSCSTCTVASSRGGRRLSGVAAGLGHRHREVVGPGERIGAAVPEDDRSAEEAGIGTEQERHERRQLVGQGLAPHRHREASMN